MLSYNARITRKKAWLLIILVFCQENNYMVKRLKRSHGTRATLYISPSVIDTKLAWRQAATCADLRAESTTIGLESACNKEGVGQAAVEGCKGWDGWSNEKDATRVEVTKGNGGGQWCSEDKWWRKSNDK